MAKTPTDIRSLARKHTALAVRVLKEVASSPRANQSARVSAASALLDRGWGKPKQEIEHSGDAIAEFLHVLAGSQTERIPKPNGHDSTAANGHARDK